MASRKGRSINDTNGVIKSGKRRYSSEIRAGRYRQTRAKIVSQAVRIAREEGLEALSFPRLAKEAQVGLRTLFRHVPTRRELIAAVITSIRVVMPEDANNDFASILDAVCRRCDSLGKLASHARLSDELFLGICHMLRIDPDSRTGLTLSVLLSPASWQILRQQHALSFEQALEHREWSIRQLAGSYPRALPLISPAADEQEFID